MVKDRIMTVKELAEYMKLSERTILNEARNGDLPGVKVGSQWRFNFAAIDKYLQEDIMHGIQRDEASIVPESAQDIIPLSRLMSPALMDLDMKAETKDEVLSEIAEIAYKGGAASNKKMLLDQLRKREKMLSTAVGNGIAIPHSRNPEVKLFRNPNILITKSKKGVDFQAPDNKKVHLFFMTCAPNMVIHLRLLAKLSKLLHVEGIVDKFMEIPDSEEMLKVLLTVERSQLFPWD